MIKYTPYSLDEKKIPMQKNLRKAIQKWKQIIKEIQKEYQIEINQDIFLLEKYQREKGETEFAKIVF